MSLFKRLFGSNDDPPASDKELRPVPGATAYSHEGEIIYNMLDPMMQQFMGRCIGAVKKAGIAARGSGQFSILISEGSKELVLDKYWQRISSGKDDPSAIISEIVEDAKELADS